MSSLHEALKGLAPISFSEVPQDESDLESWLSDLYSKAQVILDSIPIADPSSNHEANAGATTSLVASSASDMVTSGARSPAPSVEHQALQKEWGKPIKLSAKENALGMSVYKLGGKDGRGAWFARRSVHEGLPFSKFQKALEMEFPESLAVQGAPGEGNVRGIGGETKVEDIKVPSKGRVEVYRLSAQFPGPTTPRDFVTLLVTSDSAMESAKKGEPIARHYMIVSKPCDHPKTQPQNDFVRGFYESVEFIREVPKPIKISQSAVDLPQQTSHHSDISRDAITRNARQKTETPESLDEASKSTGGGDPSRKRSSTVPARPPTLKYPEDDSNPVEWIMVTRSDPGGSVPRFMVERGTPSSICADAEKFLNWACQQDFDNEEVTQAKDNAAPAKSVRRESFQSFRKSRMVGVDEFDASKTQVSHEHAEKEGLNKDEKVQQPQGGLIGAVSGAAQLLSSYTPQVVLDHLPGTHTDSPESGKDHLEHLSEHDDDDDAATTASFESADSHLITNESEIPSPTSSRIEAPRKPDEHLSHHEKELLKLEQRRAALENKYSESRERLQKDASAQNVKEEQAKQKAAEKHERELKKHQEKYEKELKKLEAKQQKEKEKIEAKRRKEAERNEKVKLIRERDEARNELGELKKEADLLRSAVEDLQKENTALAVRLGRASLASEGSEDGNQSPPLSRHGSPRKSKERGHHHRDDSTATSIKSQLEK